MSTETPRTDAVIANWSAPVELFGHARMLERELAAAQAELTGFKNMLQAVTTDRNPNGKTLIDFFNCWLDQERSALAAARQENERLREALREAARGFGLAYVTAAKHLHDETLLHCGHHEAAARRALGEEG